MGSLKIIKNDSISITELVNILSFYFDYPILQCISIANIIETVGESEVIVDDIILLEDVCEVLIKEGLSVKLEIIENEK